MRAIATSAKSLAFSTGELALIRALPEELRGQLSVFNTEEVAMATVMERPLDQNSQRNAASKLDGFLGELGELSRRYGIAIGDGAELYLMEPEDYVRTYIASEKSELSFA